MSKVQQLAKQIEQLTAEELSGFRRWYAEFDSDAWDQQIEADAQAGKLDRLAEKALRDHADGKSTKLRITTRPLISGRVIGRFRPSFENWPTSALRL